MVVNSTSCTANELTVEACGEHYRIIFYEMSDGKRVKRRVNIRMKTDDTLPMSSVAEKWWEDGAEKSLLRTDGTGAAEELREMATMARSWLAGVDALRAADIPHPPRVGEEFSGVL